MKPIRSGLRNSASTTSTRARYANFPPSADITGIQRFGGRGDCIRPITNDYYYIADMSYTKGKHQMAWGVTVVDKFLQQLSASWTQGAFSFDGRFTGNGMGDFLLGNPEVAQGAAPGAPNRVSLWGDAYFEDQIRLTRNFTLTASVRYQYHPWYSTAGSTPTTGAFTSWIPPARAVASSSANIL